MMIKLIKPSKLYYDQYKEMMDEWHKDGGKIAPWPLSLDYEDEEKFDKLLKHLDDVENGRGPKEFSSSSTFWVYDDESKKIVGATNIRHKIIGVSGNLWGHIGYGIRPSERRKGYAKQTLKLAMEEAKKLGIKNIYVAAYTENIGSIKTIESCGFDFEETLIDEECGKEVRKYCYSFRKRYANDSISHDGVDDAEYSIINGKDESQYSFNGDICYNKFYKVSKPALLPSGKPYLDSGYTWMEFYDYESKNCLTAMYDENKQIVEWYYDIARKIGKDKETNIPYEDDLYLDVICNPDGSHIVLDRDELDDAYNKNEITEADYNMAIEEADRIIEETNFNKLKEFTDYWIKQ